FGPNLVAPKFQIYNMYRLAGDDTKAAQALAAFQQAKRAQQAADDSEDMEWCFYAELYDPIQAQPAYSAASAAADVKFDDRKLPVTFDPATAGMLTLDADGKGSPDLLVWSRAGIRLYRNGVTPVSPSGLEEVKGVISVAAGDFDNDGLTDLCVLTESGPLLFRNVKGRFARYAANLPAGRFEAAVWLDFDHDYDLDLFLFGEKSVLLRNEGANGFQDYSAHFPFAQGHAIAATAFRVVPDTKGIDLAVSYADRKGVLYRDQLRGVFTAEPLDALPEKARSLNAIDMDNDSWIDLVFATPSGADLALNRHGKFVGQPLATSTAGPIAVADLDNRGFADLIAGNSVYRNEGLTRFAAPKTPEGFPASAALVAADFTGNGRTDIAAIGVDGSLHLLSSRTATENAWLRVALDGVKNLKTAAGTEVEIKAGDHYQKKQYEGTPLLFGLGRYKKADTVRISWPNGMIQNEPDQKANRTAAFKEAPRLSGSCPMVFTWNGREFQFITDVLGVAPLGASSGDGNYFPVDHNEWIQIPGEALAATDGRYEVRVTEELHEVSYIDKVQLIAVDHPATTEIYTNEKFKSPPFPDFRLFGVSRPIAPISAHDGEGRDWRNAILERDGVYAKGFQHNSAGVAGLHTLDLDFGTGAAPANRAVLVLNGWVDWADGSTFYAASQESKDGLILPYLQVKDAQGKWRTVVEDMGIPAGKPKTIVVDLTGKFLSASREVRIVTNLCVYWDQIFLSDNAGAPEMRMTALDAETAGVHLRGFSRPVIASDRERPEVFQYANWTPGAMWNQTPGLYTRYGDVTELVRAVDDRFVIMGAGDEMKLLYDARKLPALTAGWKRDFLLLVDGWAKDADANTAYSQTVEPLPFHTMSAYPYSASERFPDDPAHRAWRAQYNTRPAIRFIPPLAAR
ncbi:MAG: CRTAC1 family protein, partial [Bryobacteraceae bacterium]